MTASPDTAASAVPGHVPAERVIDMSYEAYTSAGDDPYLAVAKLHEGTGIDWCTDVLFGTPGWVISRNAYVQEAFSDWETFSSDYRALEPLGITWKLNPLEFDPPEHHYYRFILNPFFTPARVREMDAPVQAACDELIDRFAARGSCEFISEFAEMFPSHVFLDLMGMPKDKLEDFLEWERLMLREKDMMKRAGAMLSVLRYMEEFVRQQRENPTTELLRGMVGATYNKERPLTEEELLGMCYLFYIGGLDTVYSVLGWVMRHLAGDVALQDRLRDNPDLLPGAVEEFMRAFGVATPTRRVRRDCEFHGVQMKAGDVVVLSTPAASRDPLAYDEPHRIDIERKGRHVSFATGPHICLGMHLARREIRMVIETFLARFRNIRIAEGEQYEYHSGGVFGIDRLPLEWDPV
ncbi:cytochrome P450 [Mangrovimicrobium sediminis]|uniref:Cytochrome P450 n=1 Tax=Mangrovimicrobium sediminis TaxID=2562682 RepID=A0A4Z0LW08_9GAMM|nr:cytochrome P450 [Haliea sp. SAOS-164]TGD71367.1 cytochrome P450 [Haliea sp. SAOS-164]